MVTKKEKIYEGELVLENIPASKRQDVLNLIKNLDHEAQRRDFMDRILWREEKDDDTHFYISENQLTVFMGEKIGEAFKNQGKLTIAYNPEGPVRVKWEFY